MFTVKIDSTHQFKMNHHGSGYLMESDYFWKGYGGTEKFSAEIWTKLSKQSSVILDVGANTGVYALAAACVNPDARVFAFEPSEASFKILEENVKLNSFQKLECVRAALSDKDGLGVLHLSADENDYTATLEDTSGAKTREVRVPLMSLKTFIFEYAVASLDLMKIDVEQHEHAVVKGMAEYLHIFRPAILLEVLTQEQADRLMKMFDKNDYLFFNINEEKGIRPTERLEKSDHNNCLALPKERKLEGLI